MNSLTTTLPSPIADPGYEKYLRDGITHFKAKGYTEPEIRNWLAKSQGLDSATVVHLLPPENPMAPVETAKKAVTPDFLNQLIMGGGGVGAGRPSTGTDTSLKGVAKDWARGAVGAVGLAARGATLGASEYVTDAIPPLKRIMEQTDRDSGVVGTALEMAGGLWNPFQWLKTARYAPSGVRAFSEFMAPGVRSIQPGLKGMATRTLGHLARGEAYAGIYGFNTGEGGLGGRALNAAGTMAAALPVAAGVGVTLGAAEGRAAAKAARARGGIGADAASGIAESMKAQPDPNLPGVPVAAGKLREPSAAYRPGDALIDDAGPLERSRVVEALRASPEGWSEALAAKQQWLKSQKHATTAIAHEIVGLKAPDGAEGFPNPKVLADKMVAEGEALAQPLFQRLNTENPVIPMDELQAAALAHPHVRDYLLSKDFQRLGAGRVAGDRSRMALGQAKDVRGKIMGPAEIQAVLTGTDPRVSAAIQSAEQQMGGKGKLDPKTAAAIAGTFKVAPRGLDFRTAETIKWQLDGHLSGNPTREIPALKGAERADLEAARAALVEAMKRATIQPDGSSLYGTALNFHAGGHVEQEAFERGLKAAATPIMTEHLLQDPKLLAQGKAAVEQARLGVAMGLYNQLDESGKLASETNPWTPPRQAIMRLVAPPELQPKLDDFFTTMEKKAKAFELVRDLEPRIQTRQTETSGGQVAAATAQAMTGRGIGWRLGNFVQGRLSRMNPKTARDIIRAYYFMDPNDVLAAIRGQAYQPSQVPGMAGFGVGVGVNRVLGPAPPQP